MFKIDLYFQCKKCVLKFTDTRQIDITVTGNMDKINQ